MRLLSEQDNYQIRSKLCGTIPQLANHLCYNSLAITPKTVPNKPKTKLQLAKNSLTIGTLLSK